MKSFPQGATLGVCLAVIAVGTLMLKGWTRARAPAAAGLPALSSGRTASEQSGPAFSSPAAVPAGPFTALIEFAQRANQPEMERLLAETHAIDDRDIRFELRRILLGRLARWDGAAAARFLATLPGPDRLPALTATVAGAWTTKQPAAAIGWIAGTADAGVDAETAAALGQALASQSLATMKTLLASIETEGVRTALSAAVIEQWKHRRPAEAANLALATSPVAASGSLLGAVLPEWAQSDLNAAVDWARRLPNGEQQLIALVHLSQPWAGADVVAAAEFARTLPPGQEQFTAAVLEHWVQRDAAAAAAWASRLPAGATRDRVTASLVSAWARHDPAGATAFSLSLPADAGRQGALVSAVSSWATHDPWAAATWATAFPAGETRSHAIATAADNWMRSDPVAAMTWLQRLPPGVDRDTALAISAGSLGEQHPDLAITLAAAISDETLRAEQADRAASTWLAREPATALSWIAGANLPSALKQRLRQLQR
ncbi:MAG TPA: hypothetical protein VGD88_13365 [Opitutaceae bacterium]